MEKILIIDDEKETRQMLNLLLAREGYQVGTANDGEMGLELMNSFNPRIIILDLNMPKMDGIEFLKQLQPEVDNNYSIIVITGYGSDQEVKTCYRLGIHSFLRKPVNIHEILGLIKRNLGLINFAEQLKKEKKEKENAYQFIKNTFDSMSEGVITLDSQFRVRMISDKACRMLEIPVEKALHNPAANILGNMVCGPTGKLMELFNRKTEISECQTQFMPVNGATIPVNLIIKPLNSQAVIDGWLLLFSDIREEERINRENQCGTVFGQMISNAPNMLDIFRLIEKIAPSDATILIQGESGTGKELVAREIHNRSRRAQRPFQVVNCAAIPANLMESELFGHEKGAFTGAVRKKIGRFELADSGTLLLDELSELPLDTQAKLLRVLQERTFERVGGTKTIQVNVRIIAATNQNLKKLVAKKQFREDLFFRLDVITVDLPALRDRLLDIPLLVSYFIKKLNERDGRRIKNISANVSLSLLAYSWPGNVRELFHVMEYLFAVSNGDTLQQEHLPKKLRLHPAVSKQQNSLRKNEKKVIMEALKQASYNKRTASNLLGMSLATMYRKIKKHKI